MRKIRFMRGLGWAGLCGLALAAAGIHFALPAVAASGCPACFGLIRIAPGLYSDSLDLGLVTLRDEARARVAVVFGTVQSAPVVMACHTKDCDARLGGAGALGMSYGAFAVRIAPKGANVTILAHELAHAELHHRVGMMAQIRGDLPAWLNEGLAVLISQDARYLGANGLRHPACAQIGVLPQRPGDWAAQSATDHATLYPQAACAAQVWLNANGGLAALPGLLDRIAARDARLSLMQPVGG